MLARNERTNISIAGPAPAADFGFNNEDALAADLREALPDYHFSVDYTSASVPTDPGVLIQTVRDLVVYVPWETLADAAITAFAGALSTWLTTRVKKQKAEQGETAGSDGRTSRERKDVYRISIYGPRNQILAVVTQDPREDHAKAMVRAKRNKWRNLT